MDLPPHLIKVLNGPHSGAQCFFDNDEELVVGNSDTADIFLSDPHITASHFKIRAEGSSYLVTPLMGVLLINGKRIAGPESITTEQVITAGSTSLAVGPADTLWPPLTIPDASSVAAVLEPTPPSEDSLSEELLTGGGALRESDHQEKPPLFAGGARLALLFLAVLAVLLFLGWLTFSGSEARMNPKTTYIGDFEVMRSKQVAQNAGERIKPLVEQLQTEIPGAVSYVDKNRTDYQLRIFVRGQDQAMKARTIVGKSGSGIFAEVVNLDEIDRLMRTILNEMNLSSVTETTAGDGNVTFGGYIPSIGATKSLASEVATEFPYMNQRYDHLLYGDQLLGPINAILASQRLSTVNAVALRDGIHFQGSVSPLQDQLWNDTFARIKEKVGGDVGLFADLRKDAASADGLDKILGAPVAAVSFGAGSWIQLDNGNRLFRGSTLPNGMVLMSITPREILVSGPHGVMSIDPASMTLDGPATVKGKKGTGASASSPGKATVK